MDGLSVDFECVGRFALAYEEQGQYHGSGSTRFENEVRRNGKRSAGGFQCGGTGNCPRRGLNHADQFAGVTFVNFRCRRANVVMNGIDMETQGLLPTQCTEKARLETEEAGPEGEQLTAGAVIVLLDNRETLQINKIYAISVA